MLARYETVDWGRKSVVVVVGASAGIVLIPTTTSCAGSELILGIMVP
jgi:hypothetical protein